MTFIWGSTFSVTKFAVGDIPPLLLQGMRFALAAAVVGIYTRRDIRATTRSSVRAGIVLGFLLGGGFALQTVGIAYTTASNAGFLTGTLVVFTPLLQTIIERKAPGWANLAGVALVAAGLAVFTSPSGAAFGVGDLLVLACAVLFALHVVYLDVFTKERFDREIVFYQFLVTSLLGFLLFPFIPSSPPAWTLSALVAVVYLALFASAFALFILSKCQRETTPTRAALIYTMEPVIAAVIASLALGERMSGTAVAGAALMTAGLM
ncbi:MAG: DMT family transporter, partial [Bacteroidota bacterium]|nr:DMT family transporter [Bacteroidota bacterium]